MFDLTDTANISLRDARIVTPNGIIDGGLTIEHGQIAAFGPTTEGQSLNGAFLIPGIVDLHTDHAERHVHPRMGVVWPFLPALLTYDAAVISGGTTTVFDSISVGASLKKPERREILHPLLEAIAHGAEHDMFRAQHFVHLRCEISDPETPALVDWAIQQPLSRLVSVMDHTPGDRQSPNIEEWFQYMVKEMALDQAEGEKMMHDLFARSQEHGAKVRAHCVTASKKAGVPYMSHDDASPAHVDEACAEGCTISEFPTTRAAAEQARARGLAVVAGAPNYLRGGSQSGNVAVAELLAASLVDVLASDYIPRSPLDAAFAIAADSAMPYDLPEALALVTSAPARLAGLQDRGEIDIGKRADLVAVELFGSQPVVRGVWRAGRQVH